MMNSVINFGNITPAAPVVRVSFTEKFLLNIKKKPRFSSISFRDEDGNLGIKVTMVFKGAIENTEIYTSNGTAELVEAILSAYNGDLSKMADYKEEEHEVLHADEGEDMRVEMFKCFLYSPYQFLRNRPFVDVNGTKYFCGEIEYTQKCRINFCLPGLEEMNQLYHEIMKDKEAA